MAVPYQRCSDVPFHHVSGFLQRCSNSKRAIKERELQRFRESNVQRTADDIFQVYRLLLPKMDAVRGNYHLKEGKLAPLLVAACGLDPKSYNAKQAIGWRKKAGVLNAGNFVGVMEQYLLRRNCELQEDDPRLRQLTVGQVNAKLDDLALTDSKEEQVNILRWLLLHTTPTQMKWLLAIILKDVKVGMSDERILRDFHQDAEMLYNMSMDLQRVTRELADPNRRMPRRDVEPGNAIRPQLCARANSLEDAFARMKGKPFVAEVKFDGVRMQVHLTPDEVQYYSRRGREHGEYFRCNIFDRAVRQQVRHSKCILDGEMVVWNKSRCEFMPFGGFRSAMIAAGDNLPADEVVSMTDRGAVNSAKPELMEPPLAKELEVVFICFDILFCEEESVINRTLQERLQLLEAAVAPAPPGGILLSPSEVISGRVVPLLPDQCLPGLGPDPYSKVGSSLTDLEDMYNRAVARQEEGVVVKALHSPWGINDRSGAWLKVKPDYLANVDIDCLIIGGYNGTGRHGGKISEFLLALAEQPLGGAAEPNRWVSFCRVGTGMSDDERERLREQLASVLAVSNKAPRYYRIAGTAKERPDAWVTDPLRSVVLTVKSDVRMIVSKVYAAEYSLRFPRVEEVRWDKSALEVNTDADLRQLVLDNQGSLAASKALLAVGGLPPGEEEGGLQGARRWRKGGKKGPQRAGGGAGRGGVVGHLMPADVSGVEVQAPVLQGKEVCFLNFGAENTRAAALAATNLELSTLVAQLGGKIVASQRLSRTDYVLSEVMSRSHQSVQRIIRAGERGQQTCDIISTAWLRECAAAQELLPIMPRHYVYLSSGTRHGNSETDVHGDPFFQQVTPDDVQQLLKVLMDKGAWTRAQDAWAKAEKQLETAEAAETAHEHAEGAEAPCAAAQALLDVQQQLQQLPQAAEQPDSDYSQQSLFLGCTIMLARLQPSGIASTARQQQKQQDVGDQLTYMDGEQQALAAVAKWRAVAEQQLLSDFELQIMAHRGQIASSYSSKVTHIVMWDPAAAAGQSSHLASAGSVSQPSLGRAASLSSSFSSDAITATDVISTLLGMLLHLDASKCPPGPANNDKAAAQAAAVRGAVGVPAAAAPAAPAGGGLVAAVAAAVQSGARGEAAMHQVARHMETDGPGSQSTAAAAAEGPPAAVVKQLRRIRRRLANSQLHLVSSAWVPHSLAGSTAPAAAADGQQVTWRRKTELLYTPAVLREALAAAAPASGPPDAPAGPVHTHGTGVPEAAQQQQSGTIAGRQQQQQGVWSWPWGLAGLAADAASSSSDSDSSPGAGRKGATRRRASSSSAKRAPAPAKPPRPARGGKGRPADAAAAASQEQEAAAAGAAGPQKRPARPRATKAAAAAAQAAAGDKAAAEEEEDWQPASKRKRATRSKARAVEVDVSTEDEVGAAVPELEAAAGPSKAAQRLTRLRHGAARHTTDTNDVQLQPDVPRPYQEPQLSSPGKLLHATTVAEAASGAAEGVTPSKLRRLPPVAGSLSTAQGELPLDAAGGSSSAAGQPSLPHPPPASVQQSGRAEDAGGWQPQLAATGEAGSAAAVAAATATEAIAATTAATAAAAAAAAGQPAGAGGLRRSRMLQSLLEPGPTQAPAAGAGNGQGSLTSQQQPAPEVPSMPGLTQQQQPAVPDTAPEGASTATTGQGGRKRRGGMLASVMAAMDGQAAPLAAPAAGAAAEAPSAPAAPPHAPAAAHHVAVALPSLASIAAAAGAGAAVALPPPAAVLPRPATAATAGTAGSAAAAPPPPKKARIRDRVQALLAPGAVARPPSDAPGAT